MNRVQLAFKDRQERLVLRVPRVPRDLRGRQVLQAPKALPVSREPLDHRGKLALRAPRVRKVPRAL